MKKFLFLAFALVMTFVANAKESAWICADHAEDYSWWCFVYDDIQQPTTQYGYYKVWVKWEYATSSAQAEFDTKARISKQLYEISHDFTEYRILQAIDYDSENNVIEECGIPSKRTFFVPETIGESIALTTKDILLKHD